MGRTHKYYQQPDAAADIATGAEIRNRYARAASTLLGVMLASPHEAAARLSELDPVYWQDSDFCAAAKALFAMLEQGREVSVRAVSVMSGHDEDALYILASQNASLDFDTALSMFLPIYQFFVEWTACTSALLHTESDGGTAEDARAVAQMIREKRRQYIAPPTDNFEGIDAWVRVKMEGCEYDHICKPHLQTLQTTGLITAFEPGCMYVVAARPSMGKTHFVCGLLNQFEQAGARGIFFSADMDTLNIQKRLVGMRSGLNPRKDWSMLTQAEKKAVSDAHGWVKGMKCRIIDNVVDLSRVQAICSAEQYREPINYLVFDYLQLFRTEGARDRYSIVTAASIAIKQLGKSLGVPVIALSQLSRDNEKRGGSKRPTLSDLRDSGAIEENATVVAFLHRQEYYDILAGVTDDSNKGTGEVIVAKSQTGETGACLTKFDGVTGWADLVTDAPEFDPAPPSFQTVDFSAARPKDEDTIPF